MTLDCPIQFIGTDLEANTLLTLLRHAQAVSDAEVIGYGFVEGKVQCLSMKFETPIGMMTIESGPEIRVTVELGDRDGRALACLLAPNHIETADKLNLTLKPKDIADPASFLPSPLSSLMEAVAAQVSADRANSSAIDNAVQKLTEIHALGEAFATMHGMIDARPAITCPTYFAPGSVRMAVKATSDLIDGFCDWLNSHLEPITEIITIRDGLSVSFFMREKFADEAQKLSTLDVIKRIPNIPSRFHPAEIAQA